MIGLVLLIEDSHSFGLGMGKIVAFCQLSGIVLNCRIPLKNINMYDKKLSERCLIISYKINKDPVILLQESCLIIFLSLVIVMGKYNDTFSLISGRVSL